jgi:hypothetical protein
MVFAADKLADAILLREKNTVPWLISRANCLPKQAEEICPFVFWWFAFLVGLEDV